MTVQLTPTQILAGAGLLLALFIVWRWSARKARRAADEARASARVVSLAGRVVFTSAAFTGVQWLVITHPGNPLLLLVVLGIYFLVFQRRVAEL